MVLAFCFCFLLLVRVLVGWFVGSFRLFVCWGVVCLFVCFVLVYLSRFDLYVVN